MAKKKYIPKQQSDGLRPEERVAQKFAEQLIEKLEGAKLDWKQPWFSNVGMGAPQNFDGRRYNGMNQMFLALQQEKMGYQLPVWITFQRAKDLGVTVNKGEKSMTVWLGSRTIFDKDGKKITGKEYDALSDAEKNECSFRPFAKAYAVFNIQQTNYPELHPEEYSALKERMMVRTTLDESNMIQVSELDDMIKNQTWLCPILPVQQNEAFYSISRDSITVPLKGQFVDGESFYKTLLHEMAHSTGAESRLNRIAPTQFGSSEYAREELVAEMTSAIVANSMGFSSGIKEDSVAYLQSWLDALKQSPKFMLTLMKDVNKACAMVEGHVYNKVAVIQAQEAAEAAIADAVAADITDDRPVERTIAVDTRVTPEQLRDVLAREGIRLDDPLPDNGEPLPLDSNAEVAADYLRVMDNRVTDWTDEYSARDSGVDASGLHIESLSAIIDGQRQQSRAKAAPTSEPPYRVETGQSAPVYGQKQAEPKLNKAFLGNGITLWEDGDVDYTGHISPDRTVTLDKEFTAANRQLIERLAEYGNMTYSNDGKTRTLILEPRQMATHLLLNPVTGELYPVAVERLNPDKPGSVLYCTGQTVLDESVKDRLVPIRYPQEYVFSITGLQNLRPVLAKMVAQGIDVTEMHDMLDMADDIIANKSLSRNEIEDKVLYFHVKDNRIDGFNRLADELGPDLPRYWFHDNRLQYNRPGREASKRQSDAQILAGGESIVRIKGLDNFLPALERLAGKGVAILPKLEAEMQLMAASNRSPERFNRDDATLYLFVRDGVVADTEPDIDDRDYDLPKFICDAQGIRRWAGQRQDRSETNDITNHLNNKSMENKQENKQETKKELKDGLYLFPMKSGDYGINEVKNGVATPTIPISKNAPELKAFFEAVKGNSKEVRDAEIKKLADKYLTPDNIAAAQERKAQRAQEAANGEKKESKYLHLPQVKPEVRERIANVRTFKMQDGKTMAVSADIDGAHMTKPMGEKLQNTFFAKAKGTTGDEKKELDIAVAAMAFHKELAAPKQEQEQSAGLKR